ncbi:PspC domain-containing protein [Emcibacter nanhaiensis]|uniref:PspC domain-containing protein n=1 Tax=Emcibacter nanhaiensis TaxID=1505037 RepID=A0A501PG69_9PROT|nr:PspC domain-containing protein [Emcibacter nanhaiensis]TPD59185.1 PspC domain-containing protein [Emcibacter nanhaiensis]
MSCYYCDRRSCDCGANRLYKDKIGGMISGVFSGLGEFLGINKTFLRILGILGIFMTGPIVILIYFIAALVMAEKPLRLYQ